MMTVRHGLRLFQLLLLTLLLSCTLAVGLGPSAFSQASQLVATAQTNSAQDKGSLSPGAKIERGIAGGEAHTYSLTLAAGEFVQLVVEDRGSDLILLLQDPEGKTLVEVNSAIGFPNQKRLSFVASQAGDYQVTMRPARKDAARGSYTLKAVEWRQTAAKDEGFVIAERVFAEAEALNLQGSGDATRQAIEKYDATLPLWRAAGERLPEAFTLLKIGLALHNLSRFKEAIDRYSQALPVFKEIGDERGVAQTLTNLGWSHFALGQSQNAIDCYNASLEIRRRLGEPRTIAQTLNLVAEALQASGEQQQAIDRYVEALPLARAGGDPSIEAYALNGLAWLYIQSGEFEKGLDCVDRALPLWRSVGNVRGEAQSLHLRGTIHSNWVYAAEAMGSFQQAIQIWRDVGNRYGEAGVLNNIGVLYQHLGDLDRAKEAYLQALAIWQAIGNRTQQARTLNNLGLIERLQERLPQSLEFFQQSLAIHVAAGDRGEQAFPLHNIGAVRFLLGDSGQALDYMGRALKIHQETGRRSLEQDVLSDLGFVFESLGDEQSALENYRRALPASAASFNLARLESKRGNLAEALSLIEKNIANQERFRERIPDQDLRVSFSAKARFLYELHADILMRLHESAIALGQPSETYLTAALEASERAHARGLLETLAESRAEIRQGADPTLIAEERAAQDRLNARATRRAELLNSKGQEKRLAAIEKEIQELEWQLNDVRARIRTRSPKYAELMHPTPLNAGEIQKLLDDDTVLLEYLLGEERGFLWTVTPTSIKGFVLPGRAEIDAQVRRMYELLTKPDQTPPEISNVRAGTQSHAITEYDNVAATLSRLLLGPVAGQLDKKRLLIVSDGALEYIPFAALPSPAPAERTSARNADRRASTPEPRPLIVDHEIVSLPSASVLAVVRRELTGRQPAPKALAVLADPVFSNDDPRVAASRATNGATPVPPPAIVASRQASVPDIRRPSGEAGLNDFVRLRFSRQEAEAITSLLPEKDRLKALDFTASRATAQSPELGQYRILHFATHGLLNSRHPELSGLVFSLINEQGQPQDGFLRFHEIYNLKLNADLVVLSACQTALGKEVRGEGLIGLTRGFMYAGAPRVVASLWRVEDRATAELMRRFYQGMLKESLRPAAALRAAQVAMLTDRRWAAPHYWAWFTLQGEWR